MEYYLDTKTKLGLGALSLICGWFGAKAFARRFAASMVRDAIKIAMTDAYDENILEFISAARRYGIQEIGEANLRAQGGKTILRPLGSPRKMPDFDDIVFDIAQLRRLPTMLFTKIDTKMTIGKHTAKPIICDIPIIVSGMAYGEALSENAKVALAKGAAMAGTASVTGEGPWLESERRAAKSLILQYNRGTWNKEPEKLRRADGIEIQLGQGALGGIGHVLASNNIDKHLRKQFGIPPGKAAIAQSRQPGVNSPEDFYRLVQRLKDITEGVPIGVKMGAGINLETDLSLLVECGVDFISLDGARAATKGAPPITSDDFGLPAVIALSRAVDFLNRSGYRDRVALLIGGKIRNPGEMLKAIALGADGVYIGSAALFAVAHTQVLNSMPLEPPTQSVWYDGKRKNKFDAEEGAKSLSNFLISCKLELEEGIRALGRMGIYEVCRDDMAALTTQIADITGLPLAYARRDPDRHLIDSVH